MFTNVTSFQYRGDGNVGGSNIGTGFGQNGGNENLITGCVHGKKTEFVKSGTNGPAGPDDCETAQAGNSGNGGRNSPSSQYDSKDGNANSSPTVYGLPVQPAAVNRRG